MNFTFLQFIIVIIIIANGKRAGRVLNGKLADNDVTTPSKCVCAKRRLRST